MELGDFKSKRGKVANKLNGSRRKRKLRKRKITEEKIRIEKSK